MNISRRSFISGFIAVPALLAVSPLKSFAADNEKPIEVRLMTPAEYIESVNESGSGWVTWSLDDNGEVVVVDKFDTLDPGANMLAVNPAIVYIAVWVGSKIAGKVIAHVIDGIIRDVTGADLTTWGRIAARQLLNRGVPSGQAIYLSCDIYPRYSGEYHRCMSS